MSKTTTPINIATQKSATVAAYTALIQGIENEAKSVVSYVLNGATVTRKTLLAKCQQRLAAAQATAAARTALAQCVAAEKEVGQDVAPLRAAFRDYLKVNLGKTNPKLQAFGFTPAKTPQKSAASKAAGVAKAQATREAKKAALSAATEAAPNAASEPSPAPAPAVAEETPVQGKPASAS